jgi:hypothetical protein
MIKSRLYLYVLLRSSGWALVGWWAGDGGICRSETEL